MFAPIETHRDPLMPGSWYALTVQPNHEQATARALSNRGLETYLPVHRVRRRWSDRIKETSMVLFPGYLFCRFGTPDKLLVQSSVGVRSIVSRGRYPLPVDDAEINSLRVLIATGRPVDICPYVRVGQPVSIEHGPMASLRGVVTRVRDNWRVLVSVEALGCSVAVEVDADQLRPAFSAEPHAAQHPSRSAVPQDVERKGIRAA